MTVLIVITCLVYVLLVLVAGIRPSIASMSMFELKRRSSAGSQEATNALKREQLRGDEESLLRLVVALFLVIFVLLSVATFGWIVGVIVATIGALEYGALARVALWHDVAQRQFERYEHYLLEFVDKYKNVFVLFRTVVPEAKESRLGSKEELRYLIDQSGSVLNANEKRVIDHSLRFSDRLVKEIMTPRSVIESISRKEHLGPLVLNDLHATGHSRFPVIDGDIDHVVGVLHIQDLLTIDAKRASTSVEKTMEPRVFYINENQTLEHALGAFLRTRHHLFVVVNEFRETVGLLSLEDVLEALLGRRINDEFDAYEDLRAVASHNPRGNNHSEASTDV